MVRGSESLGKREFLPRKMRENTRRKEEKTFPPADVIDVVIPERSMLIWTRDISQFAAKGKLRGTERKRLFKK